MIYRTVICLWLVLFIFPGGMSGQVYTDRVVKSYKVADRSSVDVTNKYGKIHIVTWDKDSVRIEIDLRISSSSYQKMDKLRDNINFDFTTTKSHIVVKTMFSNDAGIISDFVDAFIPSNQVTINYMVYLPQNISLKIDNKFGDVYIDDFNGELNINLSNGNLKANRLAGSPSIFLSSGDAAINKIVSGNLTVSYSDLSIREAGKVWIDSKSSKVSIDKASNLDIDSKRDKYTIDESDYITASGYFSSFIIGTLKKEIRTQLKYGDLDINQVSDAFSFISIDLEITDLRMCFLRKTSYNLDITHHQDVYINLPGSLARIETKVLNADQKLMLTYGRIGSTATETSHKVKINAPRKCNINIIHQ